MITTLMDVMVWVRLEAVGVLTSLSNVVTALANDYYLDGWLWLS
jgi:hypothetical protein